MVVINIAICSCSEKRHDTEEDKTLPFSYSDVTNLVTYDLEQGGCFQDELRISRNYSCCNLSELVIYRRRSKGLVKVMHITYSDEKAGEIVVDSAYLSVVNSHETFENVIEPFTDLGILNLPPQPDSMRARISDGVIYIVETCYEKEYHRFFFNSPEYVDDSLHMNRPRLETYFTINTRLAEPTYIS